MAIAASVLTSGSGGSGASSATTASISPAADSLLLVGVLTSISGASPVPAVSGLSLGWGAPLSSVQNPTNQRVSVLRAQCGGSPGSGTLTISWAGSASNASIWSVIQITGHSATNPIPQAVNGSGLATSGSITLASGVDANSRPFAFFGTGGVAATPQTLWTELSEDVPAFNLEAQWRSDAYATNAGFTLGSSQFWAGTALEVATTSTAPTVKTLSALGVG